MTPERYPRLLLIAALLGVPAAAAAVALTTALHQIEHLFWVSIPHALDREVPPAWLVLLVPVLGGAMVALALRMPGHGGHAAKDGLSLDPVLPQHLPSVLLAAIGSISMGLVVGPEAPLIAIGLACGLVAAQMMRREPDEVQVLAFAGAFATLSTAFGGPLPSALLLFELVAMTGGRPSAALGRILLPGFLASGIGTLVFTGVGDWAGVAQASLTMPGLPAYPTVRLADLAWAIPVAGVAAAATVAMGLATNRYAALTERTPAAARLMAGGLAVGALALVFRALTDGEVDQVLFSGSTTLGVTLLETSGGVLAAIVLLKGLAFVITVGSGFRGGLIFPTVAIATAIGALAASVLPGLDLTPAVLAAIAAAAAAAIRAPFFGTVLTALLGGTAAADATPIVIVAAVVGWLIALRLEPPAAAGSGELGAPGAPADAELAATAGEQRGDRSAPAAG